MKKILFGIAFFFSIQGLASDVFVLSDIKISAEGASTLEAQTTAVANGQKEAFNLLMQKVVNPNTPVLFEEMPNVADFVQDVSLSNEKITPHSYKGDLRVRFKAEPIRTLLNQKNVSYLTALPQPMLLVPIFEDETKTLVFSTQNPLYTYWINEKPVFDLFQVKTVTNDSFKLEQAQKAFEDGSFKAYKNLLNEYDVSSILILHIKKTGYMYDVKTTVLPENSAPQAHVSLSLSDDRPNLDRVMKDLSLDAFNNMRKKWIYLSTKTLAPTNSYKLTTPISKLSDLKRIKDKIQQLNFAEHIEIKGFKDQMLWVDLSFQGSFDELVQKLKLNQLHIENYPEANLEEPVYLLTEITNESSMPQEETQSFTFAPTVQEEFMTTPEPVSISTPDANDTPISIEIDSLEHQNNDVNTL